MGIQSTRYITRETAIDRIRVITNLIKRKDYLGLDSNSFEPDYDIQEFVDNCIIVDIYYLDRWTDKMLEDYMDNPYFRFSLFDNYLIRDEHDNLEDF